MLALEMYLDVVAITSGIVAEIARVARDPPTELVKVLHFGGTEVHQVCIQVLSDKGSMSEIYCLFSPRKYEVIC